MSVVFVEFSVCVFRLTLCYSTVLHVTSSWFNSIENTTDQASVTD